MDKELLIVLMFVFGFIGLVASVAYYFLRFSFKTDVEKGLGESLSDNKPEIEAPKPTPELFKEPEISQVVTVEEASASRKLTATEVLDPGKIYPPTPTEVETPTNLKSALHKTNVQFWGRLKGLFTSTVLTAEVREQLEEVLYTSDLGPQAVERLFQAVEEKMAASTANAQDVREALRAEMMLMLKSHAAQINNQPHVIMVVGVNGAGKTTTIGKLAHYWSSQNKKVLIIAGDTFRAAARDQLKVWSARAQVEIFSQENVQDPSAVAYAGLEKGKAENYDVIIVDTAGRLHTQEPLMEELKKMKRILSKVISTAPDEVLLVLDANSGQNALTQAKAFHGALGVSSVVLTKLDGTAKGGVALGVSVDLGLPISWIGVGEKMSDLRPFEPKEFVEAIL